jgi:hypothetical protein
MHRRARPPWTVRFGSWLTEACERLALAEFPALAAEGAPATDRPTGRPGEVTAPQPAPAAQDTITQWRVPATVADIDPRLETPALPSAGASAARGALTALLNAYPGLPRGLPWRYFDDGAQLDLGRMPVSERDQRGIVAGFAAALAAPVEEHAQERDDSGYVIVSASAEYRGARIAVQATCVPDPDAGLDRMYRHFVAEDDTQQFAVLDGSGPHPLPQGAA